MAKLILDDDYCKIGIAIESEIKGAALKYAASVKNAQMFDQEMHLLL